MFKMGETLTFILSQALVRFSERCRREAGDVLSLPLSEFSGLSFDFTLLSPVLFVESCYSFCFVFFLFFWFFFSACWPILLICFPENYSSIFFVKIVFVVVVLYGSCLAARRSKLVVGMCSMLQYDWYLLFCIFIIF